MSWSTSAWFAAALLTAVASVGVVDRAATAVDRARVTRLELERTAARIAAEIAAADYVTNGVSCQEIDAGDGVLVTTDIEPLRGSDQMQLAAIVGDQQLDFVFTPLAGGTPAVLGRAFSATAAGALPADWSSPLPIERADVPELLPVAISPAAAARVARVDSGIALLRLSAGTDRDDYVLAGEAGAGEGQAFAARGVVTIDGNLWVDSSGEPLVLDLADDLTIVVRGNVYLGRSVRVRGAGCLTIVSQSGTGASFIDRDGNGRWSTGDGLCDGQAFAGPVEGAGNVWLGLPRQVGGRLLFDLGLIAGGVVHVAVDEARVHGPVVLQNGGAQPAGGGGRLVATGTRLPRLGRAALPGFVPQGSPRPGLLLQVGREPLYRAGPPR